jgi:hypothetical protein
VHQVLPFVKLGQDDQPRRKDVLSTNYVSMIENCFPTHKEKDNTPMMEILADPHAWISLLTLTVMEINTWY